MYLIIELKKLVTGLAIIVAALTFLLNFLFSPSIWESMRFIGLISTILFFVIWFLGGGLGIWRWFWKKFPKLNQWVYPDINGTWRGQIKSNWPIIARMRDAARGEAPPFDPLTSDEAKQTPPLEKPITLRIRCNWFQINVIMETDDKYSSSGTFFVAPRRSLQGEPHRLYYMYENKTHDPKATDFDKHLGGACLDIDLGEELHLRGPYWTNRGWNKGVNTAGLIDVKRISTDPDFKEL